MAELPLAIHHHHGECVGTTSTQRSDNETMKRQQKHQRLLSFDMVAELRISHHDNWATTPLRHNCATISGAGSTQLRTSESGISRTTGQRHHCHIRLRISSQRPGCPQGDQRGGTTGQRHQFSFSSCFWLNVVISSPPLIIHQQHAAQRRQKQHQ